MSPVSALAVVLVSVCGVLVACSSPGRNYTNSNMHETLEIDILPNTSKMFIYRLRVRDDQLPNDVHIERGGFQRGENARGGIHLNSVTLKKLIANAGYVVKNMGYCREGFLDLDSSASPYHLWVKGECKEGATEEDHKKFGTQQTLPVIIK